METFEKGSALRSEVDEHRDGLDGAAYAVQFHNGVRKFFGQGDPQFVIHFADEEVLRSLLQADAYSAALAFIEGAITIDGDIAAAVRVCGSQSKRSFQYWLFAIAARFATDRLETWVQSKRKAAQNIRFHYDRSNEFYRQFLDSRMVYSCAYVKAPMFSLEDAQLAKLEHICRKLDLQDGDSFLDIGCGWGGLVIHAAERHGVVATGCTLSRQQLGFADAV